MGAERFVQPDGTRAAYANSVGNEVRVNRCRHLVPGHFDENAWAKLGLAIAILNFHQ
jgi:hypothetical protein